MKIRACLLVCIYLGCNHLFAMQVPKDLQQTASGLQYKILEKGTGKKVALNKEVAFHWTGYFLDGKSFGTSQGKEPFYFITGKKQVIKGAEEGLAMMREGDRYLFVMPPELAYGSKGAGDDIPPNITLVFDYQVVSVSEPKQSIRKKMLTVFEQQGVDAAINVYQQIKSDEQQQKQYSFRENELNNLGYYLLNKKLFDDAIKIFKLNVKSFPDSWNAYDSLAEAYLTQGDKKSALKFYQKSVELNPKSEVGLQQVKKLLAEIKSAK